MGSRSRMRLAVLGLGLAGGFGIGAVAQADQPAQHPLPQSIVVAHQDEMAQLTVLTRRHGPVGAAARNSLDLFKRHIAHEQDYILPPLTLLPAIADGKATPDMAWALVMADKVKATQAEIYNEHSEVTGAANALYAAGLAAHDKEAIAFARDAVTDSLNDLEIEEPTVLLIGDYLRTHLPTAH